MYDLIGDIHGHCATLKKLLTQLGYELHQGVWQHRQRKIIFVGDYIDRGPQIKETLDLVKTMVGAGQAIALMGNHEYNAVAYATPDGRGDYFRKHNATHHKQHQATLQQFAQYPRGVAGLPPMVQNFAAVFRPRQPAGRACLLG